MADGVIFDVDGTLVDSVDQHARSWQEAFQDFGHDIVFERLREQIGKGGDQLLPVFLNDREIDDVGDAIELRRREILKERYLDEIKGFLGVRQLFERLRADGIRIALASSAKGEELLTYKQRAGIEDLVDKETSSEDAERSKPHPDIFLAALDRLTGVDRSRIVVVGDTAYDAEAAAKAGLSAVGVLCGGFSAESLREAGCIAIYDSPEDLLRQYDNSPLARQSRS